MTITPRATAPPAELLADLQLIADSLVDHHGLHAGAYAVQRLIRRVRTFGLHLARLDVRQDSRVHDDALAALLDDADWTGHPADRRTQQLRDYASGNARFAISHAEVVDLAVRRVRHPGRHPASLRQRGGRPVHHQHGAQRRPTCWPCWRWRVTAAWSRATACR